MTLTRDDIARAMASAAGEAWWMFPDQDSAYVSDTREMYETRAAAVLTLVQPALDAARREGAEAMQAQAMAAAYSASSYVQLDTLTGTLKPGSPYDRGRFEAMEAIAALPLPAAPEDRP